MTLDLNKLLRKANEGKFTIMAYVPNAFLDERIDEPKVAVYLYPGTVFEEVDGVKVGAYVPRISQVTFIPLDMIEPIKKVKAHLGKIVEIRKAFEAMRHETQLLKEYTKKLEEKNPLLAQGIISFMNGVQFDVTMTESVYQAFCMLIEEIEKVLPDEPYTEKVRGAVESYYKHSQKREEFIKDNLRLSEVFQHGERWRQKALESSLKIDQDASLRFQDEVRKENGDQCLEDLSHFVHTKVVLSCMFLGKKEFYTYKEIIETIRTFRPELDVPELLEEGVDDGLKIAIEGYTSKQGKMSLPGGTVEYNQTMDVYSLTEQGKQTALFLLEQDIEHDQIGD